MSSNQNPTDRNMSWIKYVTKYPYVLRRFYDKNEGQEDTSSPSRSTRKALIVVIEVRGSNRAFRIMKRKLRFRIAI